MLFRWYRECGGCGRERGREQGLGIRDQAKAKCVVMMVLRFRGGRWPGEMLGGGGAGGGALPRDGAAEEASGDCGGDRDPTCRGTRKWECWAVRAVSCGGAVGRGGFAEAERGWGAAVAGAAAGFGGERERADGGVSAVWGYGCGGV